MLINRKYAPTILLAPALATLSKKESGKEKKGVAIMHCTILLSTYGVGSLTGLHKQ